MCTRPGLLVEPFKSCQAAHIDDGICRTRKKQLTVLRQTQTEDAAFVRVDDFPPFIRVEAVDLLLLAWNPPRHI